MQHSNFNAESKWLPSISMNDSPTSQPDRMHLLAHGPKNVLSLACVLDFMSVFAFTNSPGPVFLLMNKLASDY